MARHPGSPAGGCASFNRGKGWWRGTAKAPFALARLTLLYQLSKIPGLPRRCQPPCPPDLVLTPQLTSWLLYIYFFSMTPPPPTPPPHPLPSLCLSQKQQWSPSACLSSAGTCQKCWPEMCAAQETLPAPPKISPPAPPRHPPEKDRLLSHPLRRKRFRNRRSILEQPPCLRLLRSPGQVGRWGRGTDGSGCCGWTDVLSRCLAFLGRPGSAVAEGSPGCSLAASQRGGTSPQ